MKEFIKFYKVAELANARARVWSAGIDLYKCIKVGDKIKVQTALAIYLANWDWLCRFIFAGDDKFVNECVKDFKKSLTEDIENIPSFKEKIEANKSELAYLEKFYKLVKKAKEPKMTTFFGKKHKHYKKSSLQ